MLLKHQETVKFDPNKKDHRAAVMAFMRRRAWGDSPIRFSYDPSYGSVAEQVQQKLLAWYMSRDRVSVPAPAKAVLSDSSAGVK